jgi:hypothetical protein
VRGLHRALDKTHPHEHHDAATCRRCIDRRLGARQRRAAGVRERDFRQTRRSRLTTLVRTAPPPPQQRSPCSGDDRQHGIDVDRSLAAIVENRESSLTPSCACARAIVERLARVGWRLVACQVPIYSPSMRFASAIDALALSDDNRRLALVEVKSSLHERRLRCYRLSSQRARDTEQLRRLTRAVERDAGIALDASILIRVTRGRAHVVCGATKS